MHNARGVRSMLGGSFLTEVCNYLSFYMHYQDVTAGIYPVKIDLTSNKLFQLSQQSIDYISKLDHKIEIIVMNS